ncbi:MAG TPA: type II secretion system secretin GspD, partial [Geobacteraceae bacterium]
MTKRLKEILAIVAVTLLVALPVPALAKGVVLNFSDVDIATMVKFISDLTGKNFIMDERVKGKISVFSPSKLSTEEAFNVFTSVLELKGFTMVQVGKVYKIIPTSAARQSGMKVFTDEERGPVNDSYVARVITLEHISAQEAVTFLQPMVSKDGYISAFSGTGMFLVLDSALNIQKLLGIVALIDSDQQAREGAEVIFLKHAGAEATATALRDWLTSRGKGQKAATPGSAPAAGSPVIADTRLNALIVFGNAADKEEVKKFVALVDVLPPTTSSKVNVYYLEHADATDVAKVLEGVVKGSAAPAPAAAPGAAPQQSPFEGGKISITPDKATNSLVILASPADYQNIIQVVQKLDKRRRQVFVEAVIAEISLNKLKDLGLQWGLLGAASDGKYATVVGQYDPQGVISTLISTLSTATSSGLITLPSTTTPANFAAVLKALETDGVVNVLSSPTILTSDNKEAEIFVGENVPFVSSTNLSSTGLSQQSVVRQDTGITLKITPLITEGEYVKLDIYQEISAVKDANSKGAAADITTTKRSAKTGVVVKDKQTVVIGGLMQDQDQETESKIPLLGDIPGLGWLFKTKSVTRTKTNLMIFLTPRVIKDASDLALVTDEQRGKFEDAARRDRAI